VIYTPPAVDESFYDEVHLEIEQGGVEAFYDYLLHLDLSGFHPKKRPPMTESKAALIALSSPSEIRFAHDWLSGEAGLPICPALSTDVYAAYLKWCRTHGEFRPRPDNQFHGALSRQPGWEKRKARLFKDYTYSGDPAARAITFPPENLIEAAHRCEEGRSQTLWITDCALAFSEAIHGHDHGEKGFG
jgi:putative DNA primase/helicase